MRIIAGKYGSRRLESLKGDATRPTSDKIKGAVFSSIGPFFQGGKCLDLFSGSGSIALEALSRGMDHAYCVDASRDATRVIKNNVLALNELERVTIYTKKAEQVIDQLKTQGLVFDLIYMDPPYALHNQKEILLKLLEANLLSEDGYLIVESSIDTVFEMSEDYQIVKEVNYGITAIRYITRR